MNSVVMLIIILLIVIVLLVGVCIFAVIFLTKNKNKKEEVAKEKSNTMVELNENNEPVIDNTPEIDVETKIVANTIPGSTMNGANPVNDNNINNIF